MKLNELPPRDLRATLDAEPLMLVEFSMTGCEPCHHLAAALAAVAEVPGMAAYECRYDGRDAMGRSAMLRRGVKTYPTLLLFRGGREIGRFTGLMMGTSPAETAERIGPWLAERLDAVEDDAV